MDTDDDFTFGPFTDFVGEIADVSITEVDYPCEEEIPEMLKDDPTFVAKREECRQRGIAAKRARVNPARVSVGADRRHNKNADRRHKDY